MDDQVPSVKARLEKKNVFFLVIVFQPLFYDVLITHVHIVMTMKMQFIGED